jgi:hypothetical protein
MGVSNKHVIKKYANRKLYDTTTSRYITLEGISELLQQGLEIQVLDRDSGRDLTPLILSQVVASEEKREATYGGTGTLQERGQALFSYVRRSLSGPAALVTSEVEKRRSELEDLVDLAVQRALNRLSIPTRPDLDKLNQRLDKLERQLEAKRK